MSDFTYNADYRSLILNWAIENNMPKYVESFLIHKYENNVSKNTLRLYMNNLNIFFNYLRKNNFDCDLVSMNRFSNDACTSFVNYILQEYSVPTVLPIISSVSSLFNYCVEEGLIAKNNFKGIKRPKVKTSASSQRKLTDDEKAKILHIANTGENMSQRFLSQELSHGTRFRNQSIVKILIDTGMKVSELVSIDIKDICFSDNSITISKHARNDKTKTFFVKKDTISSIKQCIDMRKALGVPKDEPALFVAFQGSNKHKRISIQAVDGLIKKYAKAANIKNANCISPNSFIKENKESR